MTDLGSKVVKWLVQQGMRAGVPCSELELRHLNGDDTLTPIGTYAVAALDEITIGELGAQLALAAHDHAGHLPGLQTYQVSACWKQEGSDKLEAFTTMLMRVEGRGDTGALSPTEAPTEKGLTTQLMRHLEAKERTAALRDGTALHHMQRLVERAEARAERFEDRHLQFMETLELVIGKRHERDLEAMRAARSEARLDHGAQMLTMLVPPLMGGVAKKLGAGSDVLQAMGHSGLIQFLKTLTYPQFMRILNTLGPEQQAAFAALYKEHALKGEPEESAAVQVASGPSSSSEPTSEGGGA